MLKWIQDVLYSPGPRIPVACADDADHLSLAVPISVNYFPHRYPVHSTNYQLWKVAHPIDHRKCNYSCEFCFHTTKNLFILPIDEARRGLHLLADAGMKKLNISGGEPFLKPDFIGEVFRFCKEELHLESCSVVNNGSKVTEKWLDAYGKYLDIMAISCDSFDVETSIQLGRAEKGRGTHVGRVFQVAQWCRDRCIKVKINTVVTKLNMDEDMNLSIDALDPYRWKVFQVLLLDSENTGSQTGSLRDARPLAITDNEFRAFLERHSSQRCLVPEDNEAMRDSYLNLDEEMRFLDCRGGGKRPGRSILAVGVEEALKDAGFNHDAFVERGGIFEWSRDARNDSKDLEW